MMYSRHAQGWIVVLSSIVVALNPHSARSLSDESIFSESAPPMDFSTPSTDQPVISPLDQVASPSLFDTAELSNTITTDPFSLVESDIENENENDVGSVLNPSLFNSNDIILADSPQSVIDCSATSEFLLPNTASVGKSRVRRLDNPKNDHLISGLCPLPAATDHGGAAASDDGFPTDLPGLGQLRMSPNWNTRVRESSKNKLHNSLCHVYFAGAFPWGVCSSGTNDDVELLSGQMIRLPLFGPLMLYKVSHAMLGMLRVFFIYFFNALLFSLFAFLFSLQKKYQHFLSFDFLFIPLSLSLSLTHTYLYSKYIYLLIIYFLTLLTYFTC